MANPVFPSEGGSSKIDATVNGAGYASFKRGYIRETPAGATTDTQHMGVTVNPAAVLAAASTVTPAIITAALPAISAGTNYLSGILVTGSGANAQSVVHATVSGLSAAFGFDLAIPSGTTLAMTPFQVTFPNAIPASAPSTAITVTVPSFGTGNTVASVAVWGWKSS